MIVRCHLCRQLFDVRPKDAQCECGWSLDRGCAEAHRTWCPRRGPDSALGAVEI